MPNKLEKIIAQSVIAHGAMDIGAFTSVALSHPEYGYYINCDPFGVEGDFTTAPEISQMFGEIIGAWVIDVWMQMGQPSAFNLIECGPGRGTFMADIMRVGRNVDGFAEAVQIRLIEVSHALRENQRAALDGYDVSWHDKVSEISKDMPTIILGNEFLDALPVEQLRRDENGWQIRTVKLNNDNAGFEFDWRAAPENVVSLLPLKTESSQIYEVSLARIGFISGCAEMLKSSGGAALFIDYGHVRSHFGDTLQAVRKHAFVDVLKDVGQCDITSHVDFDALSRSARSLDVKLEKLVTQGNFLKSLGIDHRSMALKNAISKTKKRDDTSLLVKEIDQGLSRLIEDDQMGDLFKVMCFHHWDSLKPAGF